MLRPNLKWEALGINSMSFVQCPQVSSVGLCQTMAQPIFRRLDSTIECYCSHAYVGKAYHLVTLSYPLLSVKKYCTGYDPRPIEPWALAQTFLRTKTKPKLHRKSISFWMHDRRAHVRSMCLLETTHVPSSSVLPWRVLLLSNLLEVGTSSNAITIVSNRAHSLLGIIKIGPHTHE